MDFQLPEYNLRIMLPEIFLFIWALVVFTFDLVSRRKSGAAVGYLALAGVAITGGILAATGYGRGFGTMFFSDPMALFFKMIFLGAAFLAIGSSFGITAQRIINHRGEFFGLLLLSTVGMMFLASSQELLSLYIGLELTTIPLFVLAAFFKDDKLSVEAGVKYLVIGAFSSALLLYGISFLYGLSGTTDLVNMKIILSSITLGLLQGGESLQPMALLILVNVLLIAGLGFKLALPPFHQWAPDVYEGAPTPVAAFLSVGSKAAGLVAFAKIMLNGLYGFYEPFMEPIDWGMLAGVTVVAALILGNVLAIRQTNIKRMLAYSSIAQAGYIMIGMLALNEIGLASVGFYLFAYMFANMGIFAIVAMVEDQTGSCQISAYRGLSRTSPFLSITMTVFLLSLAGIPPLAGFLAKYYVFAAAIKMAGAQEVSTWLYWLVGIGLITSVFALYYYANVIKMMYFVKEEAPSTITYTSPAVVVVVISLIGVVLFGLYPNPIMEFASDIPATLGLFSR
jgi:NADH-quinone oxidoreductase subunit N